MAGLLWCLAATGWTIPVNVFITGTLQSEDGGPILFFDDEGTSISESTVDLAVEVFFYPSETDPVAIDQLQTTITVFNDGAGIFSIEVVLTDELLVLDELWYTLAIDTDLNGLDPMDLFDGRFQIASVPFALSAKPVVFFNTHGGFFRQAALHAVNTASMRAWSWRRSRRLRAGCGSIE